MDPQRKSPYEFSTARLFVHPWYKVRLQWFFQLWIPKVKDSMNSVLFVCLLVRDKKRGSKDFSNFGSLKKKDLKIKFCSSAHLFVMQTKALRVFLIFDPGRKIWVQNPEIIIMIFFILCTMMEDNSRQVSAAYQTKSSFSVNFGKCCPKKPESLH